MEKVFLRQMITQLQVLLTLLFIVHERGLTQGDTLLPNLFLLFYYWLKSELSNSCFTQI